MRMKHPVTLRVVLSFDDEKHTTSQALDLLLESPPDNLVFSAEVAEGLVDYDDVEVGPQPKWWDRSKRKSRK